MSEAKPPFGQPDIVRLGAMDFSIPHCVNDVAETVALIRSHREEWLRAQRRRARPGPPERA